MNEIESHENESKGPKNTGNFLLGIKQATPNRPNNRKRANINDPDVGLCLSCGEHLTLCGQPFTLDVECKKCHRINRYVNSKQPIELANKG